MYDHHHSHRSAAPDQAAVPRRAARPSPESEAALAGLAYELLDAHADTARLVNDDAGLAEWQHHLGYLRDLQRVGREVLARTELASI
jgi:hypothetical protein